MKSYIDLKNYPPVEWVSFKERLIHDLSLIYGNEIVSVFETQNENDKNKNSTQHLTLLNFWNNKDHGLEHEYNVYCRAREIGDEREIINEKKIRKYLFYPMAMFHDLARNISYPEHDMQKQRKEKRNDNLHELYWAKLFSSISHRFWKQLSEDDRNAIIDYLCNHDYMTPKLNGKKFHEPMSIEGQITRLADRTSVSPVQEVERYWITGKRLWTPLYLPEITEQQRKEFSFEKIWEYSKNKLIDQCMFFACIFAVQPDHFSDETLQQIYANRLPERGYAIQRVREIAQSEWWSKQDIEKIIYAVVECN
jgi:hypothetical protein